MDVAADIKGWNMTIDERYGSLMPGHIRIGNVKGIALDLVADDRVAWMCFALS